MNYWKSKYALLFVVVVILLSSVKCNEDSQDDHHSRPDDPDISSSSHHYNEEGHHEEEYDHDAILGSHQESEHFKELEPEEAKRRLGILFDKMDSDKDGNMSSNELFQWIIESFKKLDAENSALKMEEMDADHDKKININEFLSKTYGHTEEEVKQMLSSKSDDMKTFLDGITLDLQKFNLADANRDSFLDSEEFIKFTHPQNYREMAPYELNRTLDDFDKNKDGLLNLAEFLGTEKMDNETETHERETFNEHDKNHNGLLETDEILEWAMPGFEKTAQSEVEHLFSETDANKDKQLSKEEVINQHELWVGSHATDYGKHLDDMKPHEEL